MKNCPLCNHKNAELFFERTDPRYGLRTYYHCSQCDLRFMDPQQHFNRCQEKERYDSHDNNPEDPRYLDFLNRLAQPVLNQLDQPSEGLDVGSGPGPAMHHLFEPHGHTLQHYDPFYANDKSLLQEQYDFVTCSETAEHFCEPAKEFQLLKNILNVGGWLGVMTYMIDPDIDFSDWWYPRDLTHVSFYSRDTFQWLSDWLQMDVVFPGPNVVLFQR